MSSASSPSQPVADALEQADPWRVAWQVVTHDVLIASLCLLIGLALAAGYILPQSPAGGTADPLAYSQWQIRARAVAGAFYDGATVLGLFDVNNAFWLRMLIAVMLMVLLLRLADRIARLVATRDSRDALREEERLRVSDSAPAVADIAGRLRGRHYRVVTSPADTAGSAAWLVADRAPWAELGSILLHVGLLVALAGVLLNGLLGWDASRQQIDTDSSATLQRSNLVLRLDLVDEAGQTAALQVQGAGQPVALSLGAQAQLNWVSQLPLPCCLTLRLGEIVPGFHISAADANGRPLTITLSSYAEPARDILLTIRRDEPGRLVAVEESKLAVLVSEANGGTVQVYAVPSGNVLTDTLVRPSITISNTTLFFKPTTSVVVAAHYRPGDWPLWGGVILALIGLAAVVVWPMQRLVVRSHGHWTEFYASGRRVRRVIRDLLQNHTS